MKVLILFAAFVAGVWGRILPDDFPFCKRSDPQIEICIRKSIDKIRPDLMKGMPEINLPPLRPYNIPNLAVDDNIDNFRIKAILTNATGWGAEYFQVKNLKVRFEDNDVYKFKLSLHFPNLTVTSSYKILSAKVLFFEDKGSNGNMEGFFTDISVDVSSTLKAVTRKGVRYLHIEDLKTNVKLGNGKVKIHDAHDGAIGTLATTVFNNDPAVFLEVMRPMISDITTEMVKRVVNDIANALPLDEILVP